MTIEKENTECKIRTFNNEIFKCISKLTSKKVVTVKFMNKSCDRELSQQNKLKYNIFTKATQTGN